MKIKTSDDAYAAGYNCGKHGADKSNSHFSFFSTPAMTAAWEQGKKQGEFESENPIESTDQPQIVNGTTI